MKINIIYEYRIKEDKNIAEVMVKVFNTDTDTLATEKIMCGVRLTKLELTFLRLAINNCWRIKYGDESNSENNR